MPKDLLESHIRFGSFGSTRSSISLDVLHLCHSRMHELICIQLEVCNIESDRILVHICDLWYRRFPNWAGEAPRRIAKLPMEMFKIFCCICLKFFVVCLKFFVAIATVEFIFKILNSLVFQVLCSTLE